MKARPTETINKLICEMISEKPEGISISELTSSLTEQHREVTKKEIRDTIRDEIKNGSLMYVQRLGQTMVCSNINKPVKISERVWIAPPGIDTENDDSDKKIIRIAAGIAFGNGIHPTTRMCLSALDELFKDNKVTKKKAIDIGTGSGILAIGAVLLGAETCIGTDIDACARAEAKANIKHNQINCTKISIDDSGLACKDNDFDLIMANLRYPTLMDLYMEIHRIASAGAYVILSGMRPEEKVKVASQYGSYFKLINEYELSGWSALTMLRE